MTAPRFFLAIAIRQSAAPVAVHALPVVDLFGAQLSATLRATCYSAHAAVSGCPKVWTEFLGHGHPLASEALGP